jgi:galactonate dehydratase
MKIKGIELTTLVEQGRQRSVLVLSSDSGLVGMGDVSRRNGSENSDGRTALADVLVGRDPFDVEALLADSKGADGTIADIELVSAATAAMLDIVAQTLRAPVHQLLGGQVHDQVRACAVGWAEDAVGKQQLAAAAQATIELGYTVLRVDPFARSLSEPATDAATAVELVQAVRAAISDDVDLVVTADPGANTAGAAELAEALAGLEPLWLEEPVASLPVDPLATQTLRLTMPLAAGREAQPGMLRVLATSNQIDHLILDAGRVGGIVEARKIAALAEVYHVDVVSVGSGGSLSLQAALQLAAATPNLAMVEVRPGLAPIEAGMVRLDDDAAIFQRLAGMSEVSP